MPDILKRQIPPDLRVGCRRPAPVAVARFFRTRGTQNALSVYQLYFEEWSEQGERPRKTGTLLSNGHYLKLFGTKEIPPPHWGLEGFQPNIFSTCSVSPWILKEPIALYLSFYNSAVFPRPLFAGSTKKEFTFSAIRNNRMSTISLQTRQSAQ